MGDITNMKLWRIQRLAQDSVNGRYGMFLDDVPNFKLSLSFNEESDIYVDITDMTTDIHGKKIHLDTIYAIMTIIRLHTDTPLEIHPDIRIWTKQRPKLELVKS